MNHISKGSHLIGSAALAEYALTDNYDAVSALHMRICDRDVHPSGSGN